MSCKHELKQALLDIEFLQECNNSANLALSVTRKELAAAKAELAELKAEILRCRTKEVHMEGVTYSTINASQVFRLHGRIAALEEKP